MRFLVSAGPTREHLDPVRFLSNRSTGRMGFAVAAAAAAAGHEVTLVAGPVALATPPGVARRIDVVSAREMLAALEGALDETDVLVMVAAVADWRPRETAAAKLKKSEMHPVIELEANPDILRTLVPRKGGRLFVGFAAETGDPLPEARRKLTAKGLDLIVANDVSRRDSGFAVDTNRVTLIAADGTCRALPLLPKDDVARAIVEWCADKRTGRR